MPSMFSDCEVTANRLAELLCMPSNEHAAAIDAWIAADERPVMRRNYYGPTRTAIDELHRRTQGVESLRDRIEEWRLDAAATRNSDEKNQLGHNVRALSQYLDQHGQRQMIVYDRRRFEPLVGRVRVSVAPHMFVHTDGMPMQLWIDCSETLRESFLVAKCLVTLWAARSMKQSAGQVEVIHSAAKRIVARGVLPPHFERDVETACKAIYRAWARRQQTTELRR